MLHNVKLPVIVSMIVKMMIRTLNVQLLVAATIEV
jgi:hypothetical protein